MNDPTGPTALATTDLSNIIGIYFIMHIRNLYVQSIAVQKSLTAVFQYKPDYSFYLNWVFMFLYYTTTVTWTNNSKGKAGCIFSTETGSQTFKQLKRKGWLYFSTETGSQTLLSQSFPTRYSNIT